MARKTSFYYSFLVLPPDERRAIISVWDFCRAVDDAVDEAGPLSAGSSTREAVQRWREELRRCYEGAAPQTPEGGRLQPFIRLGRTIRKHREGILAARRLKLSNARAEAQNNKVKLIVRRAFGFHSANAALALVHLTCGPITLTLPHERPFA